jgi:O-antigen/teichoic acid export membrane protein
MSISKFISGSALLMFDNLVVGFGAWAYWLIITKFAPAYEIGQAVSVYNLIALIATIAQLGLHYPLLKKSYEEGSRIVWTAVIMQSITIIACIPIIMYAMNNQYHPSVDAITLLTIGMTAALSVSAIFHYAILGISRPGIVLKIDIIGVSLKLVVGYILVTMGYGAFGILFSFLIQDSVTAILGLAISYKKFSFVLVRQINYFAEVLKEGLTNMPFILSRVAPYTVSVVILSSLGVASSDIAVFYLILMISIFVGEFISNMAYMVIPVSAMSRKDLTLDSTRISLSLCAIVVTALVVSPSTVLSILGTQYLSGETILVILSVATLPFVFVTNIISRLYYLGELKRLSLVGLVRILVLIVSLLFLVPSQGIFGAALSILIANIASLVLAVFWSQKAFVRYLINTLISVASGWTMGYVAGLLFQGSINGPTTIFISVTVTGVAILALKNTTISEITNLLKITHI